MQFVGPSYVLDGRKASAQRSVNLYLSALEAGGKASFIMEQVPGLITRLSIGGACRGAIEAAGRCFAVFGSGLFEIYSDWTRELRGTLSTSTGALSMDYGLFQLVIVDGDHGYTLGLSSNTFAQIADADFPGADTVRFISNYFVLTRARDGQQFNWTAINDASDIDALEFASSEYLPDDLVTHCVLNNELWLFDEKSTSVYFLSGAENVFQRNNGATMEVGVLSARSAVKTDSSLMFLGRDMNGGGMVYRTEGYRMVRVSTQAIEEALAASTDMTKAVAYTYQMNGRTFYCLNAPGLSSTWCYEISTGTWHERCDMDEFGQFKAGRVTHHAYAFGKHLGFGSDGAVYEMSPGHFMNGSDELVCERTSPSQAVPTLDRQTFSEFILDVTTGQAESGSPSVELSWSNNGGLTFGDPVLQSLGAIGQYFARLVWRRLGIARDRVWRLRFSGNARFSIINGVAR